ncbi:MULTISPECIES: Kelch repeat-containing protein [Sphingobacterium]|uniref:Kelch repeat-containing protein n=1 Tax=Sphingobacterium populi TaxID=1812824 RepID=A0ABW5UB86_9SPHI|nr:kelch repeat-containing protein [Sphingobacterium sp. CFCC 11742]
MKKKNWLALLLVGAIATTSFQSCSKDDDETVTGDTGPVEWTRSTVAPEDPREGAASFVINDQAYMVGGITSLPSSTRLNDAWAFNGSQWEPRAEFAGGVRNSAVGFAIGNAGYVGTGYDGETALNDFYRFDSASNTWTKIADFPGTPRVEATAFSLGGFGYVGLGRTVGGRTFSDMYRYDPSNDTWTLVPTQFGWTRTGAFAFVIGDRAYIGGGSFNNQLPEDFFSFDGTTWTKLNDLNRSDADQTYDVRRFNTSTFVIGGMGYIVSGRGPAGLVANVWKYNPATDVWTNEHQAIQGAGAREKAIGFALGNRGFISTGSNGTGVSSFFNETLVFTPVR